MKPAASPKTNDACSMKNELADIILQNMLETASTKLPNMNKVLKRVLKEIGVLKIGSMCSGSNITAVMIARLTKVLGAGSLREIFTCESDPQKRRWLQFVDSSVGDGQACCFGDISEMGNAESPCTTHGKCICCKIPDFASHDGPLITTCGFSCKNFSKLFTFTATMSRDEMLQDILKKGAGSTGETFQGMLSYLHGKGPPIHVWENVPELLSPKQSDNLDYLLGALSKVQYACAVELFQSLEFQIPQRRARVYGVCVRWGSPPLLDQTRAVALATKIITDAKVFATEKLIDLQNFILPDESPIVQEHLQVMMDNKVADDRIRAMNDIGEPKWRAQMQDLCSKANMSYSTLKVPAELENSEWFTSLPLREQHGLCFWSASRPDLTFLDLSQMPTRMRPCEEPFVPTLTPGAKFMMFSVGSVPRLMTGHEAMLLQGFPFSLLSKFRDSKVLIEKKQESLFMDMSGNAFTGSVIAAIIMAALYNLPEGLRKYAARGFCCSQPAAEAQVSEDELNLVF